MKSDTEIFSSFCSKEKVAKPCIYVNIVEGTNFLDFRLYKLQYQDSILLVQKQKQTNGTS